MVHVLAFGQPLKKLYLKTLQGVSGHARRTLKMLFSEEKDQRCELLPLSSNLDLFEKVTLSQDVVCHGTYRSLDGAAAGLEITLRTISHV